VSVLIGQGWAWPRRAGVPSARTRRTAAVLAHRRSV